MSVAGIPLPGVLDRADIFLKAIDVGSNLPSGILTIFISAFVNTPGSAKVDIDIAATDTAVPTASTSEISIPLLS